MRHYTKFGILAALALFVSPLQAQERQTVHVGDLTVSYGDVGEGRPIVLVHGGGLSSRMWGGFVEGAAGSYRLLTPDTRNHGGTDNPSGTFSYELAAEDLAGFISALGLESPVVMGYSDGGIIVELFLLHHPGVASAAVIGGATNRVAADDHYMSGMRAFYGYDGRGELPSSVLDALEANAPGFVERLRALHGGDAAPNRWRELHQLAWPTWTTAMTIPLEDLATIDIPVLYVLGQHDDFFNPEDALAAAEAVPQGEIAVIPGASHGAFRERPGIFSSIVLDFLERHP